MEIEQRVEFYLGDIRNRKVVIKSNPEYIDNANNFKNREIMLVNYEKLDKISAVRYNFVDPIISTLRRLPYTYRKMSFPYVRGDVYTEYNIDTILGKTRLINDRSIVLFRLEAIRHWDPIYRVPNNDIPYHKKRDRIVWRGVSTGSPKRSGSRFKLVETLFQTHPDIDVGFNKLTPTYTGSEYQKYIVSEMGMKEQLQYKFIISAEGFDVASGLKWQLFSNSVVMMVEPTISSWAMEEMLQPYIHYIPLKEDYSDTIQQLEWALNNPQKCIEISRNATNYIGQFLDIRKEKKIMRLVLKQFLDSIEIE